jgi:integrase/recombinase XerD
VNKTSTSRQEHRDEREAHDMSLRNFVEKTRNDYIRHVRTFTAFVGRSPDTATPEDRND